MTKTIEAISPVVAASPKMANNPESAETLLDTVKMMNQMTSSTSTNSDSASN